MKLLNRIVIIVIIILGLMWFSLKLWKDNNMVYPEKDTNMYFEIVFENDTVIHKYD